MSGIGHAILKRVRELGMDCVLQGFAGIVPEALRRVRPQAKITRTGWSWGGHCAWFLHPDDPLFAEICTDFIREWEKEFGPCTYYLAPEGMEQNDVVYELISCAGWSDRPIDVDAWLANYSRSSGWCARRAKTARRRILRLSAARGSTVVCRSRRPFRVGQAKNWPTKPCG